jgi:3beta-hydroxy-delta5-steroid dehydrogenase/steroid delta-isomerase
MTSMRAGCMATVYRLVRGAARGRLLRLKHVSLKLGTMTWSSEVGPVALVTGGAGFFGRVLTRRLLDEGFTVRVLDVAAHPELDPRAQLLQADLRDGEAVSRALEGVSTVFHTAALINLCGVASSRTRQLVHDVNVRGTANVIDGCLRHGVPRLVYTSSNNVVFDREIIDGDESEPYASRHFDLYTETKMLAEKRVLAAGKGGALRTCALRPGGIWGPGAGSVMIDKTLDAIAKNALVVRIGNGAIADNTHVDNLAEAQLLAARGLVRKPELVSGEAYFITDDERIDCMDWFAPLVEALGATMPRRRVSGKLMYGFAYVCEWLARLSGQPPMLTRVEILKITRTHSFRIDKARAHLGYEPRIKSAEGLMGCLPYAREYLEKRRGGAVAEARA